MLLLFHKLYFLPEIWQPVREEGVSQIVVGFLWKAVHGGGSQKWLNRSIWEFVCEGVPLWPGCTRECLWCGHLAQELPPLVPGSVLRCRWGVIIAVPFRGTRVCAPPTLQPLGLLLTGSSNPSGLSPPLCTPLKNQILLQLQGLLNVTLLTHMEHPHRLNLCSLQCKYLLIQGPFRAVLQLYLWFSLGSTAVWICSNIWTPRFLGTSVFSWRGGQETNTYWHNCAAKTHFWLWMPEKWQSSASPWPLDHGAWALSHAAVSYKLIEKRILFVPWITLATELHHYFFLQLLFWFSSSSALPQQNPSQAEYEFQLNQNLCWFNVPFLLWYTN